MYITFAVVSTNAFVINLKFSPFTSTFQNAESHHSYALENMLKFAPEMLLFACHFSCRCIS